VGVRDSDRLADFSDLVKFSRARCDEDERYLQALIRAGGRRAAEDYADAAAVAMTALEDQGAAALLKERIEPPRLVPNDLRRILKGIAAKRTLLDSYEGSVRSVGPGLSRRELVLVAAQAAEWDDHPDYKEAWKP
jgi:Family of unknown function (DUF6221)